VTFADAARRLAGEAALLFGWRPHEFWSATPAELAANFEALAGAPPAALSRETLQALLERCPDG
jgi:uncharacterized phage protein (TIGR02216 family)